MGPALAMEAARLRRALAELVALKDMKDTEGKTADYERRQPLAWAAAREALGIKEPTWTEGDAQHRRTSASNAAVGFKGVADAK